MPDCPDKHFVGVAPSIVAKELDWTPGRADKGAQQPAHLDSDESEDDEPDAKEQAVSGITLGQILVEPTDKTMRDYRCHGKDETVEQLGGLVVARRCIPESGDGGQRGEHDA